MTEKTSQTNQTNDILELEKNLADTIEIEPTATSDWGLMLLFLRFLKPYYGWVCLGIFAIPISVAATLSLPWLIIHIVDKYLAVQNLEGMYFFISLFAAGVVLSYFSDSVYTFSMQKAGQLAIAAMRAELFRHVLKLPRGYFDRNPIGVVLTRLTSDMEALGESMAIGVLSIFTDILKTIALFIFLMWISWKLTLVILLILPPIYFTSKYLRNKLRYYYNLTREALSDATGFLQECLNGIRTIQLYAAEKKTALNYQHRTAKFLSAQSYSNFYESALFSVIEAITTIALALMIWYGALQIMAGFVTIGTLVGFINTMNRIFIPIREFTQQLSVIQRAFAAIENVDRLFKVNQEEDVEADQEEEAMLEFRELIFNNVFFRYTEKSPYILKGVSFKVKRGDRIAFVGPTGSGKSTIIRLIAKTYTSYQGSITLNGIELSKISRRQLIHCLALMQQDVYLFNETIEFNIAMNRKAVDSVRVKQAAEFVFAHTFIQDLAEQYQYRVLENGTNLSAGQAQLIAFARAIAGDNEMIILDEATSSVDSVTENLIQQAIEKIFHERTVIAIAHRLSTIQNSDQILVMKEGQIIERGTHQSLLNEQGLYYNLIQNVPQDKPAII